MFKAGVTRWLRALLTWVQLQLSQDVARKLLSLSHFLFLLVGNLCHLINISFIFCCHISSMNDKPALCLTLGSLEISKT